MNIKKTKKVFKISIKNSRIVSYYEKLKIDDKLIFLESRNSNDIAGNIFYILKELSNNEYSDYKLVLSLKPELFESKQELLKTYNILNVEFVKLGSFNYYKYLFSAKFLFNDATFPAAFIKKNKQVYLNTWHGTPLKNLGKTNKNRGYGLGNVQRNLFMANYLLYPNPYMEKTLIDSFMIKNADNKIINAGYPRNNVLLDKKLKNELKNRLNIKNKNIIAYMPTWRGIYSDLNIEGQNKDMINYLNKIDKLLTNKQILYVKLHAVVKDQIDYNKYNHIKPFPENLETYHVLNMVDCLITDYSSVFFDFACSQKKIILFVYDEKQYLENIGLYFPLKDLPFPKVYNIKELIKEINTPKNYDDTEFIDKFCKYEKPNAAKNICKYVILNKKNKSIKIKKNKTNKKENILIYIDNLNSITTQLLNELIKNIDLKKRNYYLTFKAKNIKKSQKQLYELGKSIDYIPMLDNITYRLTDILKKKLQKNPNLNKINKWNLKKYYPTLKFDYYINLNPEKENIELFKNMKTNKTIILNNKTKQKIDDYEKIFINENMPHINIKDKKIIRFNNANFSEKFEEIFQK